MRFFNLYLILLIIFLSPLLASAKRKYKPEGGTGSAEIGHYNHIFDLLRDHAKKTCMRLIKHVKRTDKKFDPRARCDLFMEQIEDLAVNMGEQLVNAMEGRTSQQDMLIWAQKPYHFAQMKGFLKKAAKYTIQKKNPTDKEIQTMLSKDFNQWFLNVAVKKTGPSDGMDNLTPEALKALRKQGINLPGTDDDEDDEDIILEGGTVKKDKGKLDELLEDEMYGN